MKVFIDESGVFANPSSKEDAYSFVGALLIPDSYYDAILYEYRKLKQQWGGDAEYKGSKLAEREVNQVIRLLLGKKVVLRVVALNVAMAEDEIEIFKKEQATRFIAKIKDTTPLWKKAELESAYKATLSISCPLFRQAMSTWTLIADLLPQAVIYYIHRLPQDISRFEWYVDAKGSRKTLFEDYWSSAIMHIVQAYLMGLDYSMLIEGYDYKNCNWVDVTKRDLEERTPIDLNAMLGQISFVSSGDNDGIQLADIAVSAVSRAIRGTLGERGWGKVGRLMIKGRERYSTMPLYYLSIAKSNDSEVVRIDRHIKNVVTRLEKYAKPLLTKEFGSGQVEGM
jgi:hypothetical protein